MSKWIIVGYLIPSKHQRSFHVVVEGRPVGLVQRNALYKAMQAYPMRTVEINRFIQMEEKPTAQKTLDSVVVPLKKEIEQ